MGVVALACAICVPASAQTPQPYGTNDGGGFRNILPPGSNGRLNTTELAAFVAFGTKPKHFDRELHMYEDLVYATPGLTDARIPDFFKDATFGVRPSDVERSYSPKSGVRIVRDKGFGVPRVYGQTRADTMFGAGYVQAEDRLFFMDVLRNAGRSRLTSFAGGANRGMDRDTWSLAPYNESDFDRQYAQFDDLYGAEGKGIQNDVVSYVAGINAYIADTKLNPLLLPGEYIALGKPAGPAPWKVTDVIATATLVGSIFGKGGGNELDNAIVYQAAVKRFGRERGARVFRDFRAAEDPEAPVTVHRKRFNYQARTKRIAKGSVALPDAGTLRRTNPVVGSSGPRATSSAQSVVDGVIGSLRSLPKAMSNALLVSGRESRSGHPLAVMGPQVAYFAPQILSELELHGPGIDARGAAFNGIGLYVTLGRGRDYAWSATSASQDIIDTFVVDLCEPGGGRPTTASKHYMFRGSCLPFEVLTNTNSWQPNLADSTAAGHETLRAERGKTGIVAARSTIRGRPVAYTRLRTTYMHEADSAIGIRKFNDPGFMTSAKQFQNAAMGLGYTFHWFYADANDIAYINTGENPVRAKNLNHDFPVRAKFEWRGFDPDGYRARYVPQSRRPQVINQSYITNWNNKSARGYSGADANWEYSSIYRSQLLDDQIRPRIRGGRKATLAQAIDAMEEAGVSDIRATKVLPYVLRALGTPQDPQLREAAATLRAWVRAGGQRRDRNRDDAYERADAIRILDAWWPRLVRGALEPALGSDLYGRVIARTKLDNDPNNHGAHLGSAYQGGTYGVIQRDLRTLLGNRRLKRAKLKRLKPRHRYSRTYCGGGVKRRATLRRCRAVLARTLKAALTDKLSETYGKDPVCDSQPGLGPKDPRRRSHNQFCWDAISFRSTGAASQPIIHWVNRPTFQQAVEIERRVPR